MSINNIGSSLFDTYFGKYLSYMYAGIDATMKLESAYSCALLLSTYTEVMGGLSTGKLQESNGMRENYVKFLEYMGGHYQALHETYDLYSTVRNKLVHEFSPRPSYTIWATANPQPEKYGIEIIGGNLNFNLQEYYRDFKNGVENYRNELNLDGSAIARFTHAIAIRWDESGHRPKEKQDQNKKHRTKKAKN